MARLPIPITPRRWATPAEPCEQCTIARLDAVEGAAKKRAGRKRKTEPEGDAPEEPETRREAAED